MAIQYKIDLVQGRIVSWYAVSQADTPQTLMIKTPSGDIIVNTTIQSRTLSNICTGLFTVEQTGLYTVVFPGAVDVLQDTATIISPQGDRICQTYQFGVEDQNHNLNYADYIDTK